VSAIALRMPRERSLIVDGVHVAREAVLLAWRAARQNGLR
jgi:N-acetylglucosamine-6-phosphate deacetylase